MKHSDRNEKKKSGRPAKYPDDEASSVKQFSPEVAALPSPPAALESQRLAHEDLKIKAEKLMAMDKDCYHTSSDARLEAMRLAVSPPVNERSSGVMSNREMTPATLEYRKQIVKEKKIDLELQKIRLAEHYLTIEAKKSDNHYNMLMAILSPTESARADDISDDEDKRKVQVNELENCASGAALLKEENEQERSRCEHEKEMAKLRLAEKYLSVVTNCQNTSSNNRRDTMKAILGSFAKSEPSQQVKPVDEKNTSGEDETEIEEDDRKPAAITNNQQGLTDHGDCGSYFDSDDSDDDSSDDEDLEWDAEDDSEDETQHQTEEEDNHAQSSTKYKRKKAPPSGGEDDSEPPAKKARKKISLNSRESPPACPKASDEERVARPCQLPSAERNSMKFIFEARAGSDDIVVHFDSKATVELNIGVLSDCVRLQIDPDWVDLAVREGALYRIEPHAITVRDEVQEGLVLDVAILTRDMPNANNILTVDFQSGDCQRGGYDGPPVPDQDSDSPDYASQLDKWSRWLHAESNYEEECRRKEEHQRRRDQLHSARKQDLLPNNRQYGPGPPEHPGFQQNQGYYGPTQPVSHDTYHGAPSFHQAPGNHHGYHGGANQTPHGYRGSSHQGPRKCGSTRRPVHRADPPSEHAWQYNGNGRNGYS